MFIFQSKGKQFLFWFIYWVSCIFLHKKLSVETYKNGMNINLLEQKPLHDLIQQHFINLQPYRMVPEILHLIPIFYILGLIFYHRNTRSIEALTIFFQKHGTLMFLRSIFFSITLLPDSSKMCTVSNTLGSCFDLIFSGHTTISILCTYIIYDYFKISIKIYTLLMINNIILCILVILCRNHYSIDVFISVLLTYLIYHKK